jgi:hypothetical protein
MAFTAHIPTLYPYAFRASPSGPEYIQARLWAQDQHLVYITDYISWRGHIRFKDEGVATMCKLCIGMS